MTVWSASFTSSGLSKLKDVDSATSISSAEAEEAMSSISSFFSSDTYSKFCVTLQVLHWHGPFYITFICNFCMSDKRKLCIDRYDSATSISTAEAEEAMSSISSFFSSDTSFKILCNSSGVTLAWAILYNFCLQFLYV